MKLKKSQNAVEFMLVIFMVMIGFTALVLIMNDKSVEYSDERSLNSLIDVSRILETEIDLALKNEVGYKRKFRLPQKILNHDYVFEFRNGTSLESNMSIFTIKYENTDVLSAEHYFFTTPNITGTIYVNNNQGNNTIKKMDGYICLNC